MKFSCMTSGFPTVDLPMAFTFIRLLGFDHVDLQCFEGEPHLHPSAILADPAAQAERVNGLLRENGLRCLDVFATTSSLAPLNVDDRSVHQDNLRDTVALCDFAVRVGSPGLSVLPGLISPDESQAAALDRSISALRDHVAIAKDHGLRLSYEPHVGSVTPDPVSTRHLTESVPGLTLALDPSHFVVQGYGPEEIAELIPLAGHVQLRQANTERVQAGAHEGIIDIPAFLARLVEAGYSGGLCSEYIHKPWGNCRNVDVVAETCMLRDVVLGFFRSEATKSALSG